MNNYKSRVVVFGEEKNCILPRNKTHQTIDCFDSLQKKLQLHVFKSGYLLICD